MAHVCKIATKTRQSSPETERIQAHANASERMRLPACMFRFSFSLCRFGFVDVGDN